MNGQFLEQMAEASRARVHAASASVSRDELLRRALASPAPPALRLHPGGFDLIAELKLRSPAAGALRGGREDVAARVTAYARAGAAAVSVLTEPTRFDGNLEHLAIAARALAAHGVPVMRKDFLVDAYQVLEARAAGAGGVLAIVRLLEDLELEAIVRQARALSLFVLLEAFDESDIERMHGLVARLGAAGLLAGVNSRDLATLEVVPERLERLARHLPSGVARVAESGIETAAHARRAADAGYDLALVGSALMREDDPSVLAGAMLSAARGAPPTAVPG